MENCSSNCPYCGKPLAVIRKEITLPNDTKIKVNCIVKAPELVLSKEKNP